MTEAKNTEFTVNFTQLLWLNKFIDSIKVHFAPSQMCFRTLKRQSSSFLPGAANINNMLIPTEILFLKEKQKAKHVLIYRNSMQTYQERNCGFGLLQIYACHI